MTAPRILVTGATGTLGRHLLPVLAPLGEVVGLGCREAPEGGHRVDLTDATKTMDLLDRLRPKVILHAAGLTNVDACERDPLLAYRVNVAATRNLVDWASLERDKVRFIYISSDQVYDSPGANDESKAAPLNVYALTKLWAEDLVRRLDDYLVLRTNFFALGTAGRPTFVDWVVQGCLESRPLTLFQDVFFNPLYVNDLTALIAELLARPSCGTFNLGASGEAMSKGDFIRAVAAALELPSESLKDGKLADVTLAARRPRGMRMDVSAIEGIVGHSLPTLSAGIERLAQDWYAQRRASDEASLSGSADVSSRRASRG